MAWWDDVVSFVSKAWDVAKPVANTAWDFAKENPTLTGAGLGLITGGGTGDYGSNNFRNAVTGGAAGYAAGQLFGGGSSASQPVAGMAPSTTQMPSGAATYFGTNADVGKFAGVGSTAAAASAPTAFGAGVGEAVTSGMDELASFGKKFQTPLKVGMQLASTLDKRERVKGTESLLRDQANQEAAINADNRRIIDDTNAAERAYSAMAPKNAYSNVINATGRAVKAAGMDPYGAQTATQKKARQRALSLAGTTGATTAAANASRQPSLKQYATPSTTAAVQAADYGARADSSLWQDYAALGQSALGWDDQARRQVNP